jgi:hypothetical protein
MSEDARWLDGNALGGLLQELFATELTDAPHGCGSCGAVRAIGAHRLYRGAGLVLRCPVCSDIALVVATANSRVVHLAHGEWRFPAPDEIAAAAV